MQKTFNRDEYSYTHSIDVRVLYRDTDQMGVAYYANYLVWFEQGRTELMRSIGLPYNEVEKRGVLLPVSRCTCNYRAPARYDDLLLIETSIIELTAISISFGYRIYRKEDKTLIATGDTKHPFLDKDRKFVRFGSSLFDQLKGR